MADTPLLETFQTIIGQYLQGDGKLFIEKIVAEAVENALEEQVPIHVVSELHRQLTGEKAKKLPPGGRKSRPRCKVCDRAMKSDGEGGYVCPDEDKHGGDDK